MKNPGEVQKWEMYAIPQSCGSFFDDPDVKLAKNVKELYGSFIGKVTELFLRRKKVTFLKEPFYFLTGKDQPLIRRRGVGRVE